MDPNLKFTAVMVSLTYLNVTLTFVGLWLRRIYLRLNRLPRRQVGSMNDGAVIIYEDD